MRVRWWRCVASILLLLTLTACGRPVLREPPRHPTVPTPDAVPREEPLSKYGNPESYVVLGKRYYTLKSAKGFVQQGVASWYGKKFHGRRTSSGEIYDMYQMTAAHKQLPLPTYVEVRNLDNGRVATVKVNDRGPFHENRIIDLSYAAALKLGMAEQGTAFVEVTAIAGGKRAVARPSPAAAKQAPPPSAATAAPRGVFIQVGAFQERANAERMAARIESTVPGTVHIHAVTSAGRVLYRVQVGPVATVEIADRAVAALNRLGITDHHFVTQ